MRNLFIILNLFVFLCGIAHAHGNISKLPYSVQILQYKMKLQMNADDLDTLNNLAMAYFWTNQAEKAKEQLVLVLEKDKNNFNALDSMGLVLLKMGQEQKALPYLNRAVEINSRDCLVHAHLAVNYMRLKKNKLAKEELAKAKSLAQGQQDLDTIDKEIKLLSGT